MTSMQERIEGDLKEALVKKEALKVSVLRLLKSAIHNQEIAKKKKDKGLSSEETRQVIFSEAKKRRDSIEAFQKGGREDLVAKEQQELKIIEAYLPRQLGEDEVKKVVQEVIDSFGDGERQFGQVMGQVMARLKGQADGALVSKVVKESLAP